MASEFGAVVYGCDELDLWQAGAPYYPQKRHRLMIACMGVQFEYKD